MTIKKDTENPFIFTKKTSFMQRIADLVRTGHSRYVMGQLKLEKVAIFSAKLADQYALDGGKVAAHRLRKAGFSSARLLFLSQENQAELTWILLVTEGNWKHKDAGREKWRDPTKDKVYLTGYELVRHTRSGKAEPSWTWRYCSARYDDIREVIVLAIRRNRDDELKQWINTVWRSPAFAGVREQVKKFAALIKAEWRRTRGSDPLPELPKGIGYVRRIADKGLQLATLLKEQKNADSQERRHADTEHKNPAKTA